MQEQVLEWLLEEKDPSVRFATLTSLVKKPPDDPEVIAARSAIMSFGLVPEILLKQNEDGAWGDPDRFYYDKYTGAVWTLLILAELAADPEDSRIKKACEFILRHSQEPSRGGFSYRASARTGGGLPSAVVPCLTGNMVYALIRLGYLHDERVQKAIDWIIRYQRADDGDGEAPAEKSFDHYAMCWGKHSCHMGVAKTLKALAAVPAEERSQEANHKINEMAEYFLKHHLYKKSHHLNEVSRPGWLKLGFPLMYQTDILELLGIFKDLKISDPRLEDAIEIIKSKQLKDGKWLLESSSNGKMLVRIEKKGAPSKWITLRTLKVLTEIQTAPGKNI
ncbi:MAG TPA: nitrogen fixation protein NifH [Peptococcaceae bacterium]|nr:nitrogen fixation protein NifH [Peptococcaceae bacterium]